MRLYSTGYITLILFLKVPVLQFENITAKYSLKVKNEPFLLSLNYVAN